MTGRVGEPEEIAPTVDDAGATVWTDAAERAEMDPQPRARRLRRRSPKRSTFAGQLIEWGVLIGVAVVVALVIRAFLFQAFYIPSASMVPTLKIGDRVIVNRLSYDLHDVHRGDIIVFRAPKEARTDGIDDLVKRVIGLPGETISADGEGHVEINGRRIDESYLPAGTRTDNLPPTEIPAGHLFVMGDNRGASKDARYFGPIPESTIIGRVFLRIWPIKSIGFM